MCTLTILQVAVTLEHAGHSKDVKGAEVELREESK